MYAHATLTLNAARVAASAIRAITALKPTIGHLNGETKRFEEVLAGLRLLYQPRKPKRAYQRRQVLLDELPKPKIVRRRQPLVEEPKQPEEQAEELVYESSRCQAFLMEIIRRAAHDYVLYRQARRMELKALAEQAYTWLFEEEPGHPAWKDRERALFKIEDEETGQSAIEVGTRKLTSFLSICEACNLDPEAVRARAREMTVEQVKRTGRRTERRSARTSDESMSIEAHSLVVDIDIESLEREQQHWTPGSEYTHGYQDSSDPGW